MRFVQESGPVTELCTITSALDSLSAGEFFLLPRVFNHDVCFSSAEVLLAVVKQG